MVVHTSPYAGSWYPGDPAELRALIGRQFQESQERTGTSLLPKALGFVVPHAGLLYSGVVAASVYRCLGAQSPSTVILAGFSHSREVHGIAIPQINAYRTPLGEIEVSDAICARLAVRAPFHWAPEAALCDHSVEIQLPLLRDAVPSAVVVPLYVGQLTARERREAALVLRDLVMEGAVIVASSDFTHYGQAFGYLPFPVDDEVGDNLRRLDFELIEAAGSLEPDIFLESLCNSRSTVCGGAPITLLLAAVREHGGECFQQVLDYQTSGEITRDYHHSVSYAALGYFPADSFGLDEASQEELLEIADGTLARLESTGAREHPIPHASGRSLSRRSSVFVTLFAKERLRGCIGCRDASKSLVEAVPEMTLSAAVADPRFRAIGKGDFVDELRITILTPLRRVRHPDEIDLSRHGVYVEAGPQRGLLLPGLAREYGWTRDDLVRMLARKAGFADGRLPEGARLSVFCGQSFRRRRARANAPLV
jgi:AmmeMemoRadiSam system protein B/AmmeMemoRadiSam system protein A